MDAKLVKEWKAAYDAANQSDLEEARRRTPAQRFRRHQQFLSELAKLGLLAKRSDDLEHHLRWQELRERWIARSA